ncbi:hypothetical protein [uncultured Dubosiella sp.]|uniref:hypothetical protein n=1 Tax=uncultured Dubosiella sp. TaxID=1937011 RepID=UPI0025B5C83D|nr:hypothetical protein [uncultured Dubosiella sp.]
MRWKVKDRALMTRCMELPVKKPIEVAVLRTNCGGEHPIKVTDKDGNVFYCAEGDLMDPASKNKPAPIVKSKPVPSDPPSALISFQEVSRRFRAMLRVQDQCDGSVDAILVIQMAERTLYEDIKAGCRWEE